jgi:hypothetical protein
VGVNPLRHCFVAGYLSTAKKTIHKGSGRRNSTQFWPLSTRQRLQIRGAKQRVHGLRHKIMASLLFILFVVELVVQLVNTVGASTINTLVSTPTTVQYCVPANVGPLALAICPLHPKLPIQRSRRASHKAARVLGCSAGIEGNEQPRPVCKMGEAKTATR